MEAGGPVRPCIVQSAWPEEPDQNKPLKMVSTHSLKTRLFFIYQLKKNQLLKKTAISLTVTFMAKKDRRSPGPHHECHLQFSYKIDLTKQELRRTKNGVLQQRQQQDLTLFRLSLQDIVMVITSQEMI